MHTRYQKLFIENSKNFLAFHSFNSSNSDSHRIVFLGGFKSDMNGTKAKGVFNFCKQNNISCTIFDYFGHGLSSGNFIDGTIGRWLNDSLSIIDNYNEPQILIGSSMGGWLMLHAAIARTDKIKGLIGIASAPDFTEEEIWLKLDPTSQIKLQTNGEIISNKKFSNNPLIISYNLITEAKKHLILKNNQLNSFNIPIRLMHGMKDEDIHYTKSIRLIEHLSCNDIELHLFKDGDHRLSENYYLEYIYQDIQDLINLSKKQS